MTATKSDTGVTAMKSDTGCDKNDNCIAFIKPSIGIAIQVECT